jgi:hypothetical protein
MKPMNLSQKISSLADRDFTVLDENLTIDVGAKIMRGKGSTCIISHQLQIWQTNWNYN